MSGILGEGQLGDFLLGDSGDSGTVPYGAGQAQAQIISFGVNKFAQAQSDTKQIYFGFSQAQADIKQTYRGFAQAQGYVQPRAFGQAKASIIVFGVNRFAQARAQIKQTYLSFSQAQAKVATIRAYAQAQGYIASVNNGFGQAQAFVNSYREVANAQGYIYNPYLLAQSQAKINYPNIKVFAQAQAEIRSGYFAQAGALINSSIKNSSGQALAFICRVDTFTRSTSFGLGSGYTWVDWDSSFGVQEDSTYHVDGSKVINNPDINFDADSYQLDTNVPLKGTVKYQFTTNSTFVDWPYLAVVFGESYQDGRYGVAVWRDANTSQWYLTGNWASGLLNTTPITITTSKTYTVKMSYDGTGRYAIKVWDASGGEPTTWQIVDTRPNFVESNRAWLDFYFAQDVVSFDNLEFCIFESIPVNSYGQAQALITKTLGFAQAQGILTNTTANGCAQAYIAWESGVAPFRDTYTRTTNRGLGSPRYLWTNVNSSVDHPAATTVSIDGSRVVIPAGIRDSYYLGYTFGYYNYVEFEVTPTATSINLEPFQVVLTVPGTPELKIYFGYLSNGSFGYLMTADGSTLFGGGVSYVPNSVYKLTYKWSPIGQRVELFRDGISQGAGSNGFAVGNHFGNTNLLIEFSAQENFLFYFDSLYLDTGTTATGQARAKIKIEGSKKFAQARAKIRAFNVPKHAQAQAIVNQGMAAGNAQAIIGFNLTVGWGQAQAHISLRKYGTGQARARIKIFRWVWAQTQAYIKPRLGYGQARAYITAFNTTKSAQAQARIARDAYQSYGQAQGQVGYTLKIGQAQALISSAHKNAWGQAQARIRRLDSVAQALGMIKTAGIGSGNVQALISGINIKCGQAQASIKRTITQGQAQAWIDQPQAGNLVNFNGYMLPGYLQEETLNNSMRLNISGIIYGETYQEYIGLENKILSLRLKVVQADYAAAKEKVLLAGSIVRSNRSDWTKLTVIDPSKYYLVKTQKINMTQQASKSERYADYEVTFECKPWKYGEEHSLTGTTLIDTDTVSRNFGNGTWAPATIIVTGNNVTVSGYTAAGDFTGFVSVSGAVNGMILDSENYTVTMAGENRNDLLNELDHKIMVGPGRTLFAITGATSCEIIYQDRWPL